MWWLALACRDDMVLEGPRVVADPPVLEIVTDDLGQPAVGHVTLRNEGDLPTLVGLDAFDDPAFVAVMPSQVLAPGGEADVLVTFSPTRRGPVVSQAIVTTVDGEGTYADPARPTFTVAVIGRAPYTLQPRPWPRFPHTIDFGWPPSPSTWSLTYLNDGEADYAITDVALEDCDGAFVVEPTTATVPAGASATLTLTYTPGDRAAACTVAATTDIPGAPPLRTRATAETPRCSTDSPPRAKWVEPETTISIPRNRDLPVEVQVHDDEERASHLTCRLWSSALGGELAPCDLSDTGQATTIVVPVASRYTGPTFDVWTLDVTDACGHHVADSVPVIVDATWPLDDEDGDAVGPGSDPADCDDDDGAAYPGAAEQANGIDDDCDGTVDEGTAAADVDRDGVSAVDGDCDDSDDDVLPGAAETANGADDDCDGTVDEGTAAYDDDDDGFTEDEGDCDDAEPSRRPGNGEIADDGVDDDCDGATDEGGDDRFATVAPDAADALPSATHVAVGDQVTLEVARVGDVGIAWSADQGRLSADSGAGVVWTAEEVGTASIYAVVTAGGDEVRRSRVVITVGEPPGIVLPAPRGCGVGATGLAALGGLLVRRRRPSS